MGLYHSFEDHPFLTIFSILVVIVSSWVIPWIVSLFRNWNLTRDIKSKIDHPPAHWFYGHAYDQPGPFAPGFEWLRKATEQFPRSFALFIGPAASNVIFNNPDHIKQLLLLPEEATIKGAAYQFMLPWVGRGLVTAQGNHWFRHRKLLTGSFHFNILKYYITLFNKTTNTFIEKLLRLSRESKDVKTMKEISLLSFDSLLQTAFSFTSNCQNDETSQVVEDNHIITDIIMIRLASPLLRSDFIFRLTPNYRKFNEAISRIHAMQYGLVQQRKKEHAEAKKSKERIDFLDTLLLARDEEGNRLSEKEIQDELSTFLFAGHDTTSSALTYLFRILSLHPEHQRKIQEEVDNILQDRTEDDILWNDLPRLEYLTMCIKESQRLSTLVPTVRILLQPLTIDGKVLPAGTSILMQPYCLHHNPAVWGHDHMDFKPIRFSKENFSKMDTFSFLPFSAGHRNCIGQNFALTEIKTVAARVLRRFNLTLVKDSPFVYRGIARPLTEIIIRFQPRGKN